jgi:hypothetical protein
MRLDSWQAMSIALAQKRLGVLCYQASSWPSQQGSDSCVQQCHSAGAHMERKIDARVPKKHKMFQNEYFFKFCVIVTMYNSHGILRKFILQPKNQLSSMGKGLIFHRHKEHPRIARKIIDNHKHIPLPPKRANHGWTNSVRMKKFTMMQGHHLGYQGMGSSDHFVMATRVTDKILLKFQLGKSLDQVK